MVMGDDSYLKGRGFKSRCHILDGDLDIFSQYFVVKIVLFVWKDRKETKKRPGLAHLKKEKVTNRVGPFKKRISN